MFSSKAHKVDREKLMECNDDTDHIYENVSNRYKHKILNGIISSFTLKAKHLTRKRDKYIHNDRPASMKVYDLNTFLNQLDDDTSIFERNFEYQMDYENSYTSCEDENIYENLEYFNDDSFNNSSLNDWMLSLTQDIAEYETDNIMFVKSIPSVFSVKRTTHSVQRRLNKNEITLNFLKILWNGENNVDIMSLLLQTFSNLLRDQNKQRQSVKSDYSSLATNTLNEAVPKKGLKKSRKKLSKRFYQKCETVILSSSLNVLVITYSQSLRFFFVLAHSQVLFRLPAGVKVNQLVCAVKNNNHIKFRSDLEHKEFYRNLGRFLQLKLTEVNEILRKESEKENIYQPIWTCQSNSNDTDKAVLIVSENIYSFADYASADDSEWEVDHEFSFMNPIVCGEKMMHQNEYKTVWVDYNDDNPDYNKIFYESSALKVTVQSQKEPVYSDITSLEVNNNDVSVVVNDVNKEIPPKWYESIEAWKSLIRSPYYCEDEEEYDIFVNESILGSTFPYFPEVEDERSKNASDVIVHSSNFSLQLDESSKSSHESYRSLGEDALIDDKVTSSPKKEKERLSDRIKSKFSKSRTIKLNEANSTESIISKSDDDLDKVVFGCSLERVEKDSYHSHVPKIIVDCVNILELDINIKTPGIYRISGNKNTIDAIKKRFNDRKPWKKETPQAFLQNQDVHTLTGLLKLFFRELKTPLLTPHVFAQCTLDKQTADQIGKILKEMPEYNYATLKFLFKHFKFIEKYQDENLMNSGNLAICLGLCLFSNSFGDSPNPFDSDISKCNTLCKYLIDNYGMIFGS